MYNVNPCQSSHLMGSHPVFKDMSHDAKVKAVREAQINMNCFFLECWLLPGMRYIQNRF